MRYNVTPRKPVFARGAFLGTLAVLMSTTAMAQGNNADCPYKVAGMTETMTEKPVVIEMFTAPQPPAVLAAAPQQAPSVQEAPHVQEASNVQQDPIVKVAQLSQAEPQAIKDSSMSDTSAMGLSAPAAKWDSLLGTYVKPVNIGGVALFDYRGLKENRADRAALKDYIDYLSQQTPSTMTPAQATAYWANLYNALTIDVVVDNYPVTSIKKIKSGAFSAGPWKRDAVVVEGQTLSLDNIEHGILRVQFPSPLIHYMVNCASIGCPNLKNGLWKASTLDADRNEAARAFVNSSRGVNNQSGKLTVSSIYKWFKADFGSSDANILAHIAQYADADLKAAIEAGAKIKGDDYDWSLNE